MEESFDVIVIGLGGVGSAALAALASANYKVLGIDQFSPPHSRGSSHGETRVIRKAYFEHPDYVPMLHRAYELWKDLELVVDRQLYFPTGLLQVGPAEGEVLTGVRRSAAEHRLEVEQMPMSEACRLFPGIDGPPGWTAIVERDAGFLLVESCVEAHLQVARRTGAALVTDQAVKSWKADGAGVSVVTDRQRFRADRLIVAAGPWAADCLQKYDLPLQVIRKHVYWFEVSPGHYQSTNFPCFFFDTPVGFFYGLPQISGGGLKIGRHSGGQSTTPAWDGQHPEDEADLKAVRQFISSHLPKASPKLLNWTGCYYTMTPDQHFIVDSLPACPQVFVVAGLSGHGFKFTSVLGEIAALKSTNRDCSISTEFLSLKRFGL